ncbi:hypothetical protein [Peredibacter starrii]|uniref:Lipoprotein n=1 Tax=Peredibacter starrii TaxID=28202 RepID=A0AAX4HM17_9BACT|nr:hypothetical protein [Peredibacter starrii]WPU64304.1 hypothetical protein SOO65_16540 [Peredibacter starrii]
MKIISILFLLTLFTSCAGMQPSGNFFGTQQASDAAAAHASQAAAGHIHHAPPPPAMGF